MTALLTVVNSLFLWFIFQWILRLVTTILQIEHHSPILKGVSLTKEKSNYEIEPSYELSVCLTGLHELDK